MRIGLFSVSTAFKKISAGFARLFSRSKPAGKEKYFDSPEPTTDIEKGEDEEKEDKKKKHGELPLDYPYPHATVMLSYTHTMYTSAIRFFEG